MVKFSFILDYNNYMFLRMINKLTKSVFLVFFFLAMSLANAEEKDTSHQPSISFYTGMFDFSDDGKRAGLIGIQHQNENLFRNSFIGKISPVTGTMITESNSVFLYTGVQAEYDLGVIKFTPSFTPGYYNEGDGKDLGHPLEFKSELQVSVDLSESTNFGLSYNHISNASLGEKNPGANSYMFNFLKQF